MHACFCINSCERCVYAENVIVHCVCTIINLSKEVFN